MENPKDHIHKLSNVAEGPFKVKKAEENTVTIEKTDQSVETVSRTLVVLAPTPQTEKKVHKLLQPVKLSTEKETEKANMKYIVVDNVDDDKYHEQEEGTEKDKKSD